MHFTLRPSVVLVWIDPPLNNYFMAIYTASRSDRAIWLINNTIRALSNEHISAYSDYGAWVCVVSMATIHVSLWRHPYTTVTVKHVLCQKLHIRSYNDKTTSMNYMEPEEQPALLNQQLRQTESRDYNDPNTIMQRQYVTLEEWLTPHGSHSHKGLSNHRQITRVARINAFTEETKSECRSLLILQLQLWHIRRITNNLVTLQHYLGQ